MIERWRSLILLEISLDSKVIVMSSDEFVLLKKTDGLENLEKVRAEQFLFLHQTSTLILSIRYLGKLKGILGQRRIENNLIYIFTLFHNFLSAQDFSSNFLKIPMTSFRKTIRAIFVIYLLPRRRRCFHKNWHSPRYQFLIHRVAVDEINAINRQYIFILLSQSAVQLLENTHVPPYFTIHRLFVSALEIITHPAHRLIICHRNR